MLQRFRVLKRFKSNAWVYAPEGTCHCQLEGGCIDPSCKGQVATSCTCNDAAYCSCRDAPYTYAGSIFLWFMPPSTGFGAELEGPIYGLLARGFVVPDSTLPSIAELETDPRYQFIQANQPRPDKIMFGSRAESQLAMAGV